LGQLIYKSNIMLQNIANLKGVTVLSKEQQKNVNGGGYLTGAACTGGYVYSGGQAVGFACTYKYQRTFLGFDYGSPQELAPSNNTSTCPAGMIC